MVVVAAAAAASVLLCRRLVKEGLKLGVYLLQDGHAGVQAAFFKLITDSMLGTSVRAFDGTSASFLEKMVRGLDLT
jgi:hypothetical protein